MQVELGLDSGPMLLREAIPIAPEDTAATLHDRLAVLGARLVVDALRNFGQLQPAPQPEAGVTYARKIDKTEATLDWRRPAAELANKIRAFDPFPGAVAGLRQTPVKIWRAMAVEGQGEAGQVLAANDKGIIVACGEGALRLVELQKPGGRRLPVRDFLCGFPLAAGNRWD